MQDTILRLCASTALVGALAFPAGAQQIIHLEEITFSANLTETETRRAGASVTVLTQDDIRKSGAADIIALLRRQAGISITQNGGMGSSASMRIRGTEPRYTAIYVDGIRIDDPSGTQTQTDFGQLGLSNIGRIEILRGSQSALYGGSAVGGVVNITTLRATEDGLTQTFEAEGGSYSTARAAYGLAYRQDRLEFALGLSHTQTNGHTAFEGLPGGVVYDPNAERDGYARSRINFAARYQATDVLAVGLAGFVQRSRSEYDAYEAFGFASLDPATDAVANWRQWGLRAFAEFDLEVGKQEIGISRYRVQRRYIENVSNPVEFIFPSDNTYTGLRTKLDWKGTSLLAPGYTLVYGADWEREDYDQTGTFGTLASNTNITGAYAQLLAQPTEDFDATATVRYDHHSRFGGFLTGRVSFAWQASNDLTLRGQLARGFRAPSNFELFSLYGDPTLDPETSLSAELGADYALANGGQLSATAFEVRINGKIDYDFATSRYAQIEASRSRGLELSADLPVSEWLDMTMAYTYTDAVVTEGPNTGDRLANVPRHHLSLGLDALLADRLRGSTTLTHVAGRTGGLASYTTVDLGLRYELTDRADLTLRVTNLFDRNYQEIAGYKTPGRAFYLGVASRF